jgi:hypothetical protein
VLLRTSGYQAVCSDLDPTPDLQRSAFNQVDGIEVKTIAAIDIKQQSCQVVATADRIAYATWWPLISLWPLMNASARRLCRAPAFHAYAPRTS